MDKDISERLQRIELDTVKSVTELRVDVRNLTSTIVDLKNEIKNMSQNYVTKEDHQRDIGELQVQIAATKKSSKVNAMLWSLLTAVLTSVIVYEVMKALR